VKEDSLAWWINWLTAFECSVTSELTKEIAEEIRKHCLVEINKLSIEYVQYVQYDSLRQQ
jgi:hypothetical protein